MKISSPPGMIVRSGKSRRRQIQQSSVRARLSIETHPLHKYTLDARFSQRLPSI